MTEVRIRCAKSFKLESINNQETNIQIRKGAKGVAIKHHLANNKFFYSCEMNGYMFDMKHESFEENMVELNK